MTKGQVPGKIFLHAELNLPVIKVVTKALAENAPSCIKDREIGIGTPHGVAEAEKKKEVQPQHRQNSEDRKTPAPFELFAGSGLFIGHNHRGPRLYRGSKWHRYVEVWPSKVRTGTKEARLTHGFHPAPQLPSVCKKLHL
jgi:hypothetical protein